jgi:hypothetical protein
MKLCFTEFAAPMIGSTVAVAELNVVVLCGIRVVRLCDRAKQVRREPVIWPRSALSKSNNYRQIANGCLARLATRLGRWACVWRKKLTSLSRGRSDEGVGAA